MGAEKRGYKLSTRSRRFQKTKTYVTYRASRPEPKMEVARKEQELVTSKYYGDWKVKIGDVSYTELIDITITRNYAISKYQFEDFISNLVTKSKLRAMKWITKKPKWQHGVEQSGVSEDEAVLLRKNGRQVKRWEFVEEEIRGYFPRGG